MNDETKSHFNMSTIPFTKKRNSTDVVATVNHDPVIGYLLMAWVLWFKVHVLDKLEFDEPEYNLLV